MRLLVAVRLLGLTELRVGVRRRKVGVTRVLVRDLTVARDVGVALRVGVTRRSTWACLAVVRARLVGVRRVGVALRSGRDCWRVVAVGRALGCRVSTCGVRRVASRLRRCASPVTRRVGVVRTAWGRIVRRRVAVSRLVVGDVLA